MSKVIWKLYNDNMISEEVANILLDKHYNRLNNKYSSLFPVFIKLAETCEKETISVNDVITAEYYPKYD